MIFRNIVICLISLTIPCIVLADTSNIQNLVFATQEQSIKPNQISAEIIVQTQNSNRAPEKVTETNDIAFSSSSATGELINAAGNPVTTTMSKNTSSRTFYYRDSTQGTHTLTVTITGRESHKTFKATQQITVSTAAALPVSPLPVTSGTGANDRDNLSAHSNQEATTEIKATADFKIDAGRKRVVSIHSPIDFLGNVSLDNRNIKKVLFDWSFGDGTSGEGREITHTYKFPGEYIVVLNAESANQEAVSRTEVVVVDPKLTIESIEKGHGGFIEIKNNSTEEINIGNWSVRTNDRNFIIAKDTLIRPQGLLRLPIEVPVSTVSIGLYFPSGVLGFEYEENSKKTHIDEDLISKRTEMLRQLVVLKQELRDRQTSETGVLPDYVKQEMIRLEHPAAPPEAPADRQDSEAALMEAFEGEEPGEKKENDGFINFFKSIFSW